MNECDFQCVFVFLVLLLDWNFESFILLFWEKVENAIIMTIRSHEAETSEGYEWSKYVKVITMRISIHQKKVKRWENINLEFLICFIFSFSIR